jgi:uncharacterized protein YjbJ (UPF0337 family)
MTITVNKSTGYANQAAGSTKKWIGQAFGSNRMRSEGETQIIKGKAQVAAAQAQAVLKKVAKSIVTTKSA